MFGIKNWLKRGPSYELIHCPLCHVPMTFEKGKVPDNFYCANAQKIVKIQVKANPETGKSVVTAVDQEKGIVTFDAAPAEGEVEQGKRAPFVADAYADHLSGQQPVRMVRRVLEWWRGERPSPEEDEDHEGRGMGARESTPVP